MRKTKTIKIDDKEITALELRVSDIQKIFETFGSAPGGSGDIGTLQQLAPMCVKGIDAGQLLDLAPSEWMQIWEAVKEVNAVFFSMIENIGIVEALKGLIQKHLSTAFAALSGQAIPDASNTDGASLSMPLESLPDPSETIPGDSEEISQLPSGQLQT